MAPVNGTIESNLQSTTQQQTSNDRKKKANAISKASKSRMARNITGDRSTSSKLLRTLYVFFFHF